MLHAMPANKPAKQKRKRCENCNKLFEPKKPWSKFCKDECRKEFHRYGSSYGPLKTGLHKAIDKKYAELRRDFFREMKDQSRRIDRLEKMIEADPNRTAVEVAELRTEFDLWRGQYENHTHEYDRANESDWYTANTGQPL